MDNTQTTITETHLATMVNCTVETIRKATQYGILYTVGYTNDGVPFYLASSAISMQFALQAMQAGFSKQEVRMMIAMIEMFGGGEEYVEEVIADRLRGIEEERNRLLIAEHAVMIFRSWCYALPNGFSSLATIPQTSNRGMLS